MTKTKIESDGFQWTEDLLRQFIRVYHSGCADEPPYCGARKVADKIRIFKSLHLEGYGDGFRWTDDLVLKFYSVATSGSHSPPYVGMKKAESKLSVFKEQPINLPNYTQLKLNLL